MASRAVVGQNVTGKMPQDKMSQTKSHKDKMSQDKSSHRQNVTWTKRHTDKGIRTVEAPNFQGNRAPTYRDQLGYVRYSETEREYLIKMVRTKDKTTELQNYGSGTCLSLR